MLSTISSQLKALNAASTAARTSAASRYGRPSAISFANDAEAQHASTSRSAACGDAALKAASVDPGGLGFAMRASNQPAARTG